MSIVSAAFEIEVAHELCCWDAAIVAAARAWMSTLYSEDGGHDREKVVGATMTQIYAKDNFSVYELWYLA